MCIDVTIVYDSDMCMLPVSIDIGPPADASLASFTLFTRSQLDTWAHTLHTHMHIHTRKHHFKTYRDVFHGRDAVVCLMQYMQTEVRHVQSTLGTQ